MPDYPDWQRAYRLVGVDVTVPISIDAVTVTLNVDIVAQTVGNISVNLAASAITLNVNLAASSITLNVNLSSQTANINISFEDQSVAVFDAAKWFAHNAQHIFVNATASVSLGVETTLASRTVPTGKTMFIIGFSVGSRAEPPINTLDAFVKIDTVATAACGGDVGLGFILDTPVRATAGQVVALRVYIDSATPGAATLRGAFWGYDEDA